MSFSWRSLSIERLTMYEIHKVTVENVTEQIKALEDKYTSIRSAQTDSTPVQGGTSNKQEDMLINNISLRNELKKNLKEAIHEIKIIERGLSVLSDDERKILTRFYINRSKGYIERLCDELFISKTELYRRRDNALKRFTMVCYGIVEL